MVARPRTINDDNDAGEKKKPPEPPLTACARLAEKRFRPGGGISRRHGPIFRRRPDGPIDRPDSGRWTYKRTRLVLNGVGEKTAGREFGANRL